MTREEAKEKLYMEWQKFLEDNVDYAGISEAYKMAFKALEQEPCEDAISRGVFEQVMWERDVAIGQLKELGYEFGAKIEPCEDAISRQAVLDLAKKGVLVSNGNYESVCKAINEIPSVNPQKSAEEAVKEFKELLESGYYEPQKRSDKE